MNKFTEEQTQWKQFYLNQMQATLQFIQSLPQETKAQQEEVRTVVNLLDKTIAAIDNIFGYY